MFELRVTGLSNVRFFDVFSIVSWVLDDFFFLPLSQYIPWNSSVVLGRKHIIFIEDYVAFNHNQTFSRLVNLISLGF